MLRLLPNNSDRLVKDLINYSGETATVRAMGFSDKVLGKQLTPLDSNLLKNNTNALREILDVLGISDVNKENKRLVRRKVNVLGILYVLGISEGL